MTINEAGLKLIENFEGLRLKAYKPVPDEPGWTIGYGHHGPDVHEGMTINQGQAEEYLRRDLRAAEKAVAEMVTVALIPNEHAALVSLVYNIGRGAFADSTVLRKVNEKDFFGAADAFRLWNKAGGQVLEGLVRRREAERELFLSGLARSTAPAEWKAVCPAEDASSARTITADGAGLLEWVARQLELPFTRDAENRKVYLGHAADHQEPRSRAAATVKNVPAGPDIKSLMGPNDLHLVANRASRVMTCWTKVGEKLWKVEARQEGTAGGDLAHPRWNVTNGDTPPGRWKVLRVEAIPRNDEFWASYGWYYLWLHPESGPAAAIGDVGIGIHGGGSGLPDPWAGLQGWAKTHGCIRVQNADLEKLIVPAVKRTQAMGATVWLTTG